MKTQSLLRKLIGRGDFTIINSMLENISPEFTNNEDLYVCIYELAAHRGRLDSYDGFVVSARMVLRDRIRGIS